MIVIIATLIRLLLLFPRCSNANADINGNAGSIINRQLSASISSSTWPTTPTSPLCEAYSFLDSSPSTHDNDKLYCSTWKIRYLSSLTESPIVVSTYEDGIQLALNAARESFPLEDSSSSSTRSQIPDAESLYNASLDSNLIAFSLATRANSPQCEMYRKLSHQAISFLSRGDNNDSNAFVVVQGKKKVHISVEDLNSSFFEKKDSSTKEDVINDAWANTFPKEDIFYNDGDDETKSVLILYGKFHTKEFAEFFKYLKDQKHPFVVRYMSDNNIEYDDMNGQKNGNNDKMKTTLQGYGVRVDIRNLEYKSFDEKDTKEEYTQDKNDNSIQGNVVAQDTLNMDVVKEKWLHGIDPQLLQSHSSSQELQAFLKQYMSHLQFTNIENYHLPVIPPRSELKDISLAATTVISQSEDPIWTLTQLSQNLPSHAYALANVTIPSELRFTADKMSNIPMVRRNQEDGISQFYVNGRRMSVTRPSFNLFELLNVLREENLFLKNIHATLKDYLHSKEAMDEALSLLSMGKDDIAALADSIDDEDGKDQNKLNASGEVEATKTLRIDVGRGGKGAILYLNDIEKDVEYKNWPNDVDRALMNMQFGQPPMIRRNLITVLIVLDPFDSYTQDYLQLMGMLFQMMQGMYPIRVGTLFANQKDIDDCRQSLSSKSGGDDDELQYCLDKRYDGDKEEILKQEVSTQSMYSLLKFVQKTHGGMIALNYLYAFIQSSATENTTKMTIKSLFKIHNQSLRMMRMPSTESESELIEELKRSESDESKSTYEKAVRFASAKNIKSGMAFMNGIPFFVNEPSKAQSIVQDEINEILRMIMMGEITNSRKSVYAKLLKGPNVHKQMHPLLNEPRPSYHLFSSYFDNRTLVIPNSKSNDKSQPKVLCEAFVDFTNDSGMKLTESFLSSIKRKLESSNNSNQVHIAFRVLPIDTESAESILGKVFGNAHQFDIDDLLHITKSVRKAFLNGKDISSQNILLEFEDKLKGLLGQIFKEESECSFLPWEKDLSGSVLVNGRLFKVDEISFEDIEILFDLEYKIAKAVTNRLAPLIENEMDTFVAISRLTSFFGKVNLDVDSGEVKRTDALAPYRHLIQKSSSSLDSKNWFYHTWKGDGDSTVYEPKVRHGKLKDVLFL